VVQQKVDRVLYGGHYDFTTVTSSMANQLAQTLDRGRLVELMTRYLPAQMGIQQAALLLMDSNHLVSQDGELDQNYTVDDALCQEMQKLHRPVRTEGLTALLDPAVQEKWSAYDWGQVFAPLLFENKLLGVLILGQRLNGDIYSDEDLRIIATVSEQGALASANVLIFESQRALARQLVRSDEERRKQLSNSLHDNLLQELFFIKQGLHRDPGNPELLDYMEASIQNLRRAIKSQRPPMLDKGLTLALDGLVRDMQKVVGLSTDITWQSDLTEPLPINDEQATSMFRIAQEALHNAIKHASAENIAVRLEKNSSQALRLEISDDGQGMLQPELEQYDLNHFGRALMHERAMMIDATLQIQSLPGQGTTVLLDVPL
jgi:signal transduction histidine kinase